MCANVGSPFAAVPVCKIIGMAEALYFIVLIRIFNVSTCWIIAKKKLATVGVRWCWCEGHQDDDDKAHNESMCHSTKCFFRELDETHDYIDLIKFSLRVGVVLCNRYRSQQFLRNENCRLEDASVWLGRRSLAMRL